MAPKAISFFGLQIPSAGVGEVELKAYVIHQAGGPEQLKLEERPVPKWKEGWVLVKIKAFGLNRSEYFTRIGESPTVKFPRVLGIECVGEVAESGDRLRPGQRVMAMPQIATYSYLPIPISISLMWALASFVKAFGATFVVAKVFNKFGGF